ncbi:hypothetical protein OPIT5_01260 [Opitutaceae bacterium TAV5]|nr:hypothetical protein OPIT5_01260 [Opitutaceae bacterium TAV5]
MPDPYEEEINQMRKDTYTHLGFIALFVLGVLHVLKLVAFDWIGLAVFVVALLPQLAKFFEYIAVTAKGLEVKTKVQAGVTITPPPPEPPEPPRATTPAPPSPSVTPAVFGLLTIEEKNILKTLWHHQKRMGGKTPSRWGFKVGNAAPDHFSFAIGVALLRSKRLVWIGEKDLVYLTDEGIDFCIIHRREIYGYPLPFTKFEPA